MSPRPGLGPAKAIAVLGTASDVGKSLITAGLCRLLRRRGIAVAPFKAQNMSLNSFVTADGGEMGRAQVLQAEACRLLPEVDMNPILLKPISNCRSQVILQGKVWGQQEASSYFNRTGEFVRYVRESYERLANRFEVVVIEGAGSAAEMNLKERDLANWPMVEWADAGVLLVADIDRGGIFAQVIGTIDLLTPEERGRLLGVVINKFRGDPALFEDGVTFLEDRTGIPVLGIVPFERTLRLDQEDSVEIDRRRYTPFREDRINMAVLLLPHLSNFTDFNPLAEEPDVILRYCATPADLLGADMVVIPGSKNTLGDLDYLRSSGFPEVLARHVAGGGELIGICGGYQMLGLEVADPHGVEGGGRMPGLGFLEVTTELGPKKKTEQVEAIPLHWEEWGKTKVKGYEIHMGETRRLSHSPCFRILRNSGEEQDEGALRGDGLVWGTYLHGLFDTPGFRRGWINRFRRRKKLPSLDLAVSEEVTRRLQSEIDRWANHLERHLKLTPVLKAITYAFFFLFLMIPASAPAYERIVSLKPGLTEILFALGQGEKVVGVTEFCQQPPEARRLPKIGGYSTPNLEKILSLKPDLVVLIPDSTPPKVEEALRKGGIETFVVKTTGIQDTYNTIKRVAGKLGVSDRGRMLIEGMKRKIEDSKRKVEGRKPLRSLLVIQRRPLIVAGEGTFIGELAILAGLQNIVGESSIPYPQFSMERILERQPEVILDLDPVPPGDFWQKFGSLPAVRSGKVFPVDEGIFVPGPRLPEVLFFLIETVYGK